MTLNYFVSCLSRLAAPKHEGVERGYPNHPQLPSVWLWGIYSEFETGQLIEIDVGVTFCACDQSRPSYSLDSPVYVAIVYRCNPVIGCDHITKSDFIFCSTHILIFQSATDWMSRKSPHGGLRRVRKFLPLYELLSLPSDPSIPPVTHTSLISFCRRFASIQLQAVVCTAGKSGIAVQRYVGTDSPQFHTRTGCFLIFVCSCREVADRSRRPLPTHK